MTKQEYRHARSLYRLRLRDMPNCSAGGPDSYALEWLRDVTPHCVWVTYHGHLDPLHYKQWALFH